MKLFDCPVRATADVIDGKWKPMIINSLKARKLRFGQLLRHIPEASRKVLTDQLRELEREEIVARVQFGRRAERVEYSLTPYGMTLVPVLTVMADWGVKHKKHTAARQNQKRPGPENRVPSSPVPNVGDPSSDNP